MSRKNWINFKSTPIIIGCNYHTAWQRNSAMRFVLRAIDGDRALLETRRTNKTFWTDKADLIFIKIEYNKSKAIRLYTLYKKTLGENNVSYT